jgi:hypothetical protein
VAIALDVFLACPWAGWRQILTQFLVQNLIVLLNQVGFGGFACQLLVRFLNGKVGLLVVNNLLEQQIAVVHLTEETNLELLVAFHQLPVVLIDLLRHLSHGLKTILQRFLYFGEIFVRFLSAVVFLHEFFFVSLEVFVKFAPQVLLVVSEVRLGVLMHRGDVRHDLLDVKVDVLHVLLDGHLLTFTRLCGFHLCIALVLIQLQLQSNQLELVISFLLGEL